MQRNEVYEKVVKVLTPHLDEPGAAAKIAPGAHIIDDLGVNSARLIDVVIELEDAFGVAVGDDELDAIATIDDVVSLVAAKLG
jgi:acyl carrier protein